MTEERKSFYKNMTDEDVDKLLNKIDHVILKLEEKQFQYLEHLPRLKN